MKTNSLLYRILVAVVTLCIFVGKGYAKEAELESFEMIYTSPERIMVYQEGVFYLNELGEVLPVRGIVVDTSPSQSIILHDHYHCPYCGWGNSDGVCVNQSCEHCPDFHPLFWQKSENIKKLENKYKPVNRKK